MKLSGFSLFSYNKRKIFFCLLELHNNNVKSENKNNVHSNRFSLFLCKFCELILRKYNTSETAEVKIYFFFC